MRLLLLGQGLPDVGVFLTGLYIFLLILVPVCIFATQVWAYKCYIELRKLNSKVESLGAPREGQSL